MGASREIDSQKEDRNKIYVAEKLQMQQEQLLGRNASEERQLVGGRQEYAL
jgi:hypothetical protein